MKPSWSRRRGENNAAVEGAGTGRDISLRRRFWVEEVLEEDKLLEEEELLEEENWEEVGSGDASGDGNGANGLGDGDGKGFQRST